MPLMAAVPLVPAFATISRDFVKKTKLPQRRAGLQVGAAYVLDIPSRKKKNVTLFKIVEGTTPVRRAQLAAPRAVAKTWRNFSAKVAGENGF